MPIRFTGRPGEDPRFEFGGRNFLNASQVRGLQRELRERDARLEAIEETLGLNGIATVPIGGIETQTNEGVLNGTITSGLTGGEHTGSNTVVTLPDGWNEMQVTIFVRFNYDIADTTTSLVRIDIENATDGGNFGLSESDTRTNHRAAASEVVLTTEFQQSTTWDENKTIRIRSADSLNTSPTARGFRFVIIKTRIS